MLQKALNAFARWLKKPSLEELYDLETNSIVGETPYDTARQIINRLGFEDKRNDRIIKAVTIEVYYLEDDAFFNRLTLYADSIHLKFISKISGFADSDVLDPLPPDAKAIADFIRQNTMRTPAQKS